MEGGIIHSPMNLDYPKGKPIGILRMLIGYRGDYLLPKQVGWVEPMLKRCIEILTEQNFFKNGHYPYCYLTIKNSFETDGTDGEWHVDGFSTNLTTLPEQNFLWSNSGGTKVFDGRYKMVKNYSHGNDNVNHSIIPIEGVINATKANELLQFDPYVLHAAPHHKEEDRCMVRISFLTTPIDDVSNTLNPLFLQSLQTPTRLTIGKERKGNLVKHFTSSQINTFLILVNQIHRYYKAEEVDHITKSLSVIRLPSYTILMIGDKSLVLDYCKSYSARFDSDMRLKNIEEETLSEEDRKQLTLALSLYREQKNSNKINPEDNTALENFVSRLLNMKLHKISSKTYNEAIKYSGGNVHLLGDIVAKYKGSLFDFRKMSEKSEMGNDQYYLALYDGNYQERNGYKEFIISTDKNNNPIVIFDLLNKVQPINLHHDNEYCDIITNLVIGLIKSSNDLEQTFLLSNMQLNSLGSKK